MSPRGPLSVSDDTTTTTVSLIWYLYLLIVCLTFLCQFPLTGLLVLSGDDQLAVSLAVLALLHCPVHGALPGNQSALRNCHLPAGLLWDLRANPDLLG